MAGPRGGAGLGLAPPIGSAVSSLSHSRQPGRVNPDAISNEQGQFLFFYANHSIFFLAVLLLFFLLMSDSIVAF